MIGLSLFIISVVRAVKSVRVLVSSVRGVPGAYPGGAKGGPHRRMRRGGGRGAAAPPSFWATQFFGQRRSFFWAAAMVGGGCFSIFRRANDVTAMSKGGGCL